MTRLELQQLADIRIKEAGILLDHGCFGGAYYLVGYSVECGLKACVAKQIREYDFPDKKLILDSYTHDLAKLLGISGVKPKHAEECSRNPKFEVNWKVVNDWSEEARYRMDITEKMAGDILAAVADPVDGVLIWLKKHW